MLSREAGCRNCGFALAFSVVFKKIREFIWGME
jgi:hypothetical protein